MDEEMKHMTPLEKVTTEMAAALIPHALVSSWSPHMLAQHAKALAQAILEVCDEPSKPK